MILQVDFCASDADRLRLVDAGVFVRRHLDGNRTPEKTQVETSFSSSISCRSMNRRRSRNQEFGKRRAGYFEQIDFEINVEEIFVRKNFDMHKYYTSLADSVHDNELRRTGSKGALSLIFIPTRASSCMVSASSNSFLPPGGPENPTTLPEDLVAAFRKRSYATLGA